MKPGIKYLIEIQNWEPRLSNYLYIQKGESERAIPSKSNPGHLR